MGSHVWQRDDAWVGSLIEDNMVMVNIETGKYVTLNASANAVWQALEQPRSHDDLVQDLVASFAVDETTCSAAVSDLLDKMRELQLAAPVD